MNFGYTTLIEYEILGWEVILELKPLKKLHDESTLSNAKLDKLRKVSTEEIVESLEPGKPGSLKVKSDGTIMDGHHRIFILRERNVDVNALSREILENDSGD